MGVGGAMESAVDCLEPAGQVLVMDPNSYHSDEPEAWSLDAPSLAAWLEHWLDGTTWLTEDAPDPAWSEPWKDAASRLAQ